MRTLCPNLDKEDALETVLEVPIPEEMLVSNRQKSWQKNMRQWMARQPGGSAEYGGCAADVQFLLGVVGAPLIPFPIRSDRALNSDMKDLPIERSMAKYIVQQYVAAVGGEHALNAMESMYAMGKVRMAASDFDRNSKVVKMKKAVIKQGPVEVGGFVLWQKSPDLWNLELMLSGGKISAGSDGHVAWRQTPWQSSHASRGPPRPLRRSLQGLDPRLTANLFSESICIGERTISSEDCFVLKLESESSSLKVRSSANVEIMRHTLWGHFSQRTGLLVHLEDTHLLLIKTGANVVFWETNTESLIRDYRTINGVNVAHSGRTFVSLFRFGEGLESHARTRMEEIWNVEEVDFNVKGLSRSFFLPPPELTREEEESCGEVGDVRKNRGLACKNLGRVVGEKGGKVVAVDENLEGFEEEM